MKSLSTLELGATSMLCRISVLGEGAPSDMVCHMLKPSNGGTEESSSVIPSTVGKIVHAIFTIFSNNHQITKPYVHHYSVIEINCFLEHIHTGFYIKKIID